MKRKGRAPKWSMSPARAPSRRHCTWQWCDLPQHTCCILDSGHCTNGVQEWPIHGHLDTSIQGTALRDTLRVASDLFATHDRRTLWGTGSVEKEQGRDDELNGDEPSRVRLPDWLWYTALYQRTALTTVFHFYVGYRTTMINKQFHFVWAWKSV